MKSIIAVMNTKKYPKYNFGANMKRLIKSLTDKEAETWFDKRAVERENNLHPRAAVTNKGYPFWDTSAAYKSLKEDIKNELHTAMSHFAFWSSREEYQMFLWKVFRKHLNQELTKNLEKAYWLNRKVNK
jgi:hypothetical protein